MYDLDNDVDSENIWRSNNESGAMIRSQVSGIVHIFCYFLTISLYIF